MIIEERFNENFKFLVLTLTTVFFTSCLPSNECEDGETKCDGNIHFYCSYDDEGTYYWDKEDCSIDGDLCTVKLSGDAYCSVPESACSNVGDQVCTHQQDIGECVKDGDYFIVQAVTECVKPEICQIDDNGKGYCAVPAE